ncbi:hypothetical protein [Trichormus variabilis]|uniref:hypothetical protein n=1 Tax=Anabaena variabilis TaxID=264691 RepID=UPI000F8EDF91|nr:hypothetical protein [Trichormus variabilis]MBD2628488.1 hypothetical protein [Trichormus variabilis FACHB-164]
MGKLIFLIKLGDFMLSGVGELGIFTLDQATKALGQDIFFPGLFYNFVYAGEAQSKKAKAWISGKRKNVSSAVGEETQTLKLSFQYLDWFHLGFAYDELPQTSNDVQLPIIKTVTVPSTTPYEVADNDITTGNAANLKAYLPARGAWGEAGYRKRVTAAPAAKQFQVDTTNKKLIFHNSDAGATVQYAIMKTYASIDSIGYENSADSFGKLSFLGKGYGPEFPNGIMIYLPNITRSSIVSMDTSSDVPEFSIDFDANVPPGKRTPHQYFNLASAA